jgi:hypothetical protein
LSRALKPSLFSPLIHAKAMIRCRRRATELLFASTLVTLARAEDDEDEDGSGSDSSDDQDVGIVGSGHLATGDDNGINWKMVWKIAGF